MEEPLVGRATPVEPVERARRTSSARSTPMPRIRFMASMNPWFHHEAEWRNGKLDIELGRGAARA